MQKQREIFNHENAWININSCPQKKESCINFFKSLSTPQKTWAESMVKKVEKIFETAKLEGAIQEGKDGYQSLVYEKEYKIEVLPKIGLKSLYKGTNWTLRRLMFNYDMHTLQVFVSIPTQKDMQFWDNIPS